MTPLRFILLCVCSIFSTATWAQSTSDKPNVILIYVDDLGYGDLSCYGATKVQTSNIDRLASEGRSFFDAHSPSAVCTPSRYGVLTGEYPFRHGTEGSWAPYPHTGGLLIDTNKLTLGKLFQDEGYATASIGKWHLGFGKEKADFNQPLRPGPLELGFDYYFGLSSNNSANPYVYIEDDHVYGWDPTDPLIKQDGPPPYPYDEVGRMQDNRYTGARKSHELYDNRMTGTLFSEKAVDWIKKHREEAFFLYYAPPQIHHPFTPHPRFIGTSQAGMYGDFIHELDWMVGQLLDTLDELSLAKNTLVIFTSDNGGMYNLGGKKAWEAGHKQNGPLLGFKFGVWEGGHRVPFIARWPDHILAGSRSNELLSSLDLLSTLAALLGHELQAGDAVDSFNQLETILGEPDEPVRDHLVLLPREEKNTGLRQDEWVYISSQGDGSGGIGTSQRGGPWAVGHTKSNNSDITPEGTIRADAPKDQLYNLTTDPHQTTNVVDAHPQLAAELKVQLHTYRQSNSTRTTAQTPIPAELIKTDFQGNKTHVTTLDNPEFQHHDPSDIIKYNDRYYLWYTEHPKVTNGWEGYIRWATSLDGYEWTDQGIAIPRGEPGSIDERAAITSYVVPHDGGYVLFYTALGALGEYPGITYATASSPDGPWEKSGKPLLFPSGDTNEWDGTHNDDTNIVFYRNKWFLYYKGKPSENGQMGSPTKTVIGVATSDNLLGPYERYDGNPVFPGHAMTAWVHRDGIAAFGYGTYWSEDGFNFVKITDDNPRTVGLYCPRNFGEMTDDHNIPWGMAVSFPKDRARHIERIDFPPIEDKTP